MHALCTGATFPHLLNAIAVAAAGSIMSLSSTGGHGRGDQSGRIIGGWRS
jgi:hypothetical protein